MKTKIGKNTNLRIFGDMIQLPSLCFDPPASNPFFIHIYYTLSTMLDWCKLLQTDWLYSCALPVYICRLFCVRMAPRLLRLFRNHCVFLHIPRLKITFSGSTIVPIGLDWDSSDCSVSWKFPFVLVVKFGRAYAFLFHVLSPSFCWSLTDLPPRCINWLKKRPISSFSHRWILPIVLWTKRTKKETSWFHMILFIEKSRYLIWAAGYCIFLVMNHRQVMFLLVISAW